MARLLDILAGGAVGLAGGSPSRIIGQRDQEDRLAQQQAASQQRLAQTADLNQQLTLAKLAGLEQEQAGAQEQQLRLNALAQQFGPENLPQNFGLQGPPALPNQGRGSLRQELIRQGDLAGAAKLGQGQGQGQAGFTLSPGQVRFGSGGGEVARVAPKVIPQISVPPLGGPSAAPAAPAGTPQAAAPVDITGGINVLEEATGPLDALAGVLERVPLIGGLPFIEGGDERQANIVFSALGKKLEQAFVNNPRFPVAEVARLKSLVPATGAFSTKSAAAADLTALQRSVQQTFTQQAAIANDPNIDQKTRRDSQATAAGLRDLLTNIDQIFAADAPVVSDQGAYDALPSGSRYRDPDDGKVYTKG